MNTNLNPGLVSAFEGKGHTAVPMIQVTVPLSTTAMVDTLAQAIVRDLIRISDLMGQEINDEFIDVDMIKKYLQTLLYMRVVNVNYLEDNLKSYKSYKPMKDRLAIPTLFYQLLISIGVAVDNDYMIEFIPSYDVDGKELLDSDTLLSISNELHAFSSAGFKMVVGMPNDHFGDLEFMAMQCFDDTITSYRDSHPVYAFLHAFLQNKEVSEITGGLSRFYYGNVSKYSSALFQVYNSMAAEHPIQRSKPNFPKHTGKQDRVDKPWTKGKESDIDENE